MEKEIICPTPFNKFLHNAKYNKIAKLENKTTPSINPLKTAKVKAMLSGFCGSKLCI